MNLVQKAVGYGGKLAPLVIPEGLTSGTGLMNPSVFVDSDGDILVNLRHVNYTLYHAEGEQWFPSRWGPLGYLHPEKDQRLVTENYICRLDSGLVMTDHTRVAMLELHAPIWEFVGLEDARLVQWDGEYSIIGVRRDTTTNGVGRMEKSVIALDKANWSAKEVARTRIPAPGPDDSYCEKNWAPILDRPNQFIKWTSPVEVVQLNKDKCEQLALKQGIKPNKDQRGGSQLVRWGSVYISITHEVDLFKNYLEQKDALYRHRLCVWDDQLNLVGLGQPFSFLDGNVEFCVGAAVFEGDLLISFGFQDNAAFVLRTPRAVVEDMIIEALDAH
ncbi:hypothetical protein UFOVP1462_46 [uncultured Caudovirales phage]|uniref:Uncharacterized protein n=1 Tax=uncultured Caudovirales phage TaxID=2100421 RepID=A0A6J5S3A5_9CAUD|nr:hypothetical protein UFOVP1013_46 [uncultured Caudovirales phage]CAB4202378.1 hypothetical protein UFOVP1364_8 [uncultured Caudovirales phage]CAB4214549.1 hypothetical protein UFOVP1462_46 [uncultured Caudovirales phage]CAB5228897.1 hypothetical protein UFOVP1550_55 [uncultured Caudovirales phage]